MQIVNLDWKELDGPNVEPPTRRGFGTTLLARVVAVQCDASIQLNYLREGLHFHHGAAIARDQAGAGPLMKPIAVPLWR
ncbi:hypothetical protein [Mesorhizobium sp. Cs1299R1N3]|uniref:hypothetical protein n=1 Tax=Mesorhizobium sp. Cs1299R1N3 TaxID=3015173 RepID=UPI00301E012F